MAYQTQRQQRNHRLVNTRQNQDVSDLSERGRLVQTQTQDHLARWMQRNKGNLTVVQEHATR